MIAAAAGQIRADQIDVYAQVLLAALIEMVLMIAQAPDDSGLRLAGADAVERVRAALFAVDPARPAFPLTPPR